MKNMYQLLFPAMLGMVLPACSVKKQNNTLKNQPVTVPAKGLIELMATAALTNNDGLKPFSSILSPGLKTDSGFFSIHQQNDKYLLEIPDALLSRDILLVSRFARYANAGPRVGGFAGDVVGKKMIRFTKGPKNKIYVHTTNFTVRAADTTANGLSRNIKRSEMEPIVASFEIKAGGDKQKGSVIDVSDFISSDQPLLGIEPSRKMGLKLSALQKDRSFVISFKAHAQNLELQTQNTYSTADGFATYELNNSFVLLPEKPMEARYQDKRVGFFEEKYTEFEAGRNTLERNIVSRFRLEPKPEDVPRYLNGELVEPAKPIVYYIDPATPEKWVKYFIQGVDDWQRAFEKAGFKKAIYALKAPVNDKEWSLFDSQHNAILYQPSTNINAEGHRITDPRSGEILEGKVYWYHNMMKNLQAWYMVQAGPNDERGRKMVLDEELMGRLIRYVTSHEIGHSIGLRHNFIASSAVPVDSLRSKTFLAEHGSCPSIMDYARLNYVAQPKDHIPVELLLPRIGVYDEWAIEWGYRWFPEKHTSMEEYLDKWVTDKIGKDRRLLYVGDFGFDQNDPRVQQEDLGDDAVKASKYGISNLKIVMDNLVSWTKTPAGDYRNLVEMNKEVFTQFGYYLSHVANQIRLMTNTTRNESDREPVWGYVPKARKLEAMAFLKKELFTAPVWLIDAETARKTSFDAAGEILKLQKSVLDRLLRQSSFNYMLSSNKLAPEKERYSFEQMLADLRGIIFSELAQNKAITEERRALQYAYVMALLDLQKAGNAEGHEMLLASRAEIEALNAKIKQGIIRIQDQKSRIHLKELTDKLNWSQNPMRMMVAPAK